jgi:hypothetical protein
MTEQGLECLRGLAPLHKTDPNVLSPHANSPINFN